MQVFKVIVIKYCIQGNIRLQFFSQFLTSLSAGVFKTERFALTWTSIRDNCNKKKPQKMSDELDITTEKPEKPFLHEC